MKFLESYLQERIDAKLKRLNVLRPLSETAVKKLRQQFQIEMTYNSNAIEGNSLTLKETFWVINEGITIKGKPLKDHLEARDHYEALEFVYDLVKPQNQPTLSEQLIRTLHQLIVKKTEEEWAGRYRTGQVIIVGSDHLPPPAGVVAAKMSDLIRWFRKNQRRLHPIELAAILHHKLVFIHPFFDGNGRTARMAMNVLLMRRSYPLAIILKTDRRKYYKSLRLADKDEYGSLVQLVARSVERSLDIYLSALSPTSKNPEKLTLISAVAKKIPYSAKYLNLLLLKGRLEGHKVGRNWMTSVEAVDRYIKSRQRRREL